jgi:hypothetical protein
VSVAIAAGTLSFGGGKCLSIITENSMVKERPFAAIPQNHPLQELIPATVRLPVFMGRADHFVSLAWHKS